MALYLLLQISPSGWWKSGRAHALRFAMHWHAYFQQYSVGRTAADLKTENEKVKHCFWREKYFPVGCRSSPSLSKASHARSKERGGGTIFFYFCHISACNNGCIFCLCLRVIKEEPKAWRCPDDMSRSASTSSLYSVRRSWVSVYSDGNYNWKWQFTFEVLVSSAHIIWKNEAILTEEFIISELQGSMIDVSELHKFRRLVNEKKCSARLQIHWPDLAHVKQRKKKNDRMSKIGPLAFSSHYVGYNGNFWFSIPPAFSENKRILLRSR